MSSSRTTLLVVFVTLTVGCGAFALWLFALPPALEQARDAEPLQPPLEPPEERWIEVPVTYPLAPLADALEQSVPDVLMDQAEPRRHPADANLRYQLTATRGALALGMEDSVLVLQTEVAYRAAVRYDTRWGRLGTATCGTAAAPAVAEVQVRTPVSLTSDWSLDPQLQIDHVRPAPDSERCRVNVLGLERDVTDLLLTLVRASVEAELPAVEEVLREVPVRSAAADAWEELTEARPIGPDLSIVLQPRDVQYRPGPASTETAEHLHGTFLVRAAPQLSWGVQPTNTADTLPPLRRAADTFEGAEEVEVAVQVQYAELAHRLQQELQGTSFAWRERTVEVAGVHLSGIGQGRLLLSLQLQGAVTGAVHLVGTPVWDAEAERLRIPDLDVQVDSPQRWVRVAGQTARRFLRPTLRHRVHAALEEVPVREALVATYELDLPLAAQARLSGHFGPPRPVALVAATDGIELRALLPLRVQVAPALPDRR